MSYRRVLKYFVLTLFILFFATLGFILFIAYWGSYGVFNQSRFDSARWLQRPNRENELKYYRGGMAIDIHKHLLKVGMRQGDVVNLLGKPDSNQREEEMQYTLGMCSGLGT